MYLISVKQSWIMLNFRCKWPKWPTCCIQQRLLLKKQLSARSWFVSNDRKNERPKRLMTSVLHRPMIPHLNVFIAIVSHSVVDIWRLVCPTCVLPGGRHWISSVVWTRWLAPPSQSQVILQNISENLCVENLIKGGYCSRWQDTYFVHLLQIHLSWWPSKGNSWLRGKPPLESPTETARKEGSLPTQWTGLNWSPMEARQWKVHPSPQCIYLDLVQTYCSYWQTPQLLLDSLLRDPWDGGQNDPGLWVHAPDHRHYVLLLHLIKWDIRYAPSLTYLNTIDKSALLIGELLTWLDKKFMPSDTAAEWRQAEG